LDGEEKRKRHDVMTEVNAAYARGDEEKIRAILRDWHAVPESVPGNGPGAELVRVIRKISQVERRLTAIAAELERLRQGELFKLKQQVEHEHANGRDLLKQLADRLDQQIHDASQQLKQTAGRAAQ
jgi:hypothetical protein